VGEGVGADKVETRDGSSDLGGFDKVVDREETLATAQGRIPIVHNVKGSSTSTQVTTLQASDTRATVASTGRQAPSVKARPSKIKRAKPHRARHAIPPSKTTKAPIKRSISDLTNILNLKAPSRAETAPAGAANKKKRQRQREEIREEDNPALDKLIRIIAFAIDDKLKPVKSLGRLCEDLDQQVGHSVAWLEVKLIGRTRTRGVSSGGRSIGRTSCSSSTESRAWRRGCRAGRSRRRKNGIGFKGRIRS
jgi:hypothetical protein